MEISSNSFRSSAAKIRLLVFPLIIAALLACAPAAYSQEKDPIDVVKVNTDLVAGLKAKRETYRTD